MSVPKTPEAKRKANDKWDKENMTTLGCRVKKEEATAFKNFSAQQGKTANTILKEYVFKCIHESMEPEPTPSKPKKQYKPFTETEAANVNLQELLTNVKYQIDISSTFGMDVLSSLMEKARQKDTETNP